MSFDMTRSLVMYPLLAIVLAACTATPTGPTTWSMDRLREQLGLSNLNNRVFGAPGRITRWRTPIEVKTNDIARAETALQHYEQWTSGVVHFTRVAARPLNGLVFEEGGAGATESTAACGSLSSDTPASDPGFNAAFTWDPSRAITGTYTIHLGADFCDDAVAGAYPSSVAEHILAHALGVIDHFDGFQNRSGIDDPRLLSVVYNLYANAPGTMASDLQVWGAR